MSNESRRFRWDSLGLVVLWSVVVFVDLGVVPYLWAPDSWRCGFTGLPGEAGRIVLSWGFVFACFMVLELICFVVEKIIGLYHWFTEPKRHD